MQVNQDDIDRGGITNGATAESMSPQDVSVGATTSSEVPLGRVFGIAIGELQHNVIMCVAMCC